MKSFMIQNVQQLQSLFKNNCDRNENVKINER